MKPIVCILALGAALWCGFYLGTVVTSGLEATCVALHTHTGSSR